MLDPASALTLIDSGSPLPEILGRALTSVWVAYGLVLVLSTAYGLNAAVLVVTLWAMLRRRPLGRLGSRLLLPLELLFCLIHPLAYLLILVRTTGDREMPIEVHTSVLDPLAWLTLIVLWTLRLVPLPATETGRRWSIGLLGAGLGVIALYAGKDLPQLLEPLPAALCGQGGGYSLFGMTFVLGLIGLYAVPAAMLGRYVRDALDLDRWRAARGIAAMPRRAGRMLAGALLLFVLLTQLLLALRSSEQAVRARLIAQRDAIHAAADRTGTDPRLLAALLYEIERRQISAFGLRLEAVLARMWMVDAQSYLLFGDTIDPSIGPAQIKPVTAQTALMMVENVRPGGRFALEEYRDIPELGCGWRLGERILDDLRPGRPWFPGKRNVVDQLLRDASAIYMAALILELYARQWEQELPSWSIRQRPDILATLYQLGFERSEPKADPKSNAFGRAVARRMDDPWHVATFAAD